MNDRSLRVFALAIYAAIIATVLFSKAAVSGELSAACPAEIKEDSWRPSNLPANWVGFMANSMSLQSGGMMLGPPNSRAYLAPAKHKIVGDELTHWYSLGNLDGEKWFYCDYSGSHAIQLYRRIDDAATECIAKFSGLKTLRKLSVSCK